MICPKDTTKNEQQKFCNGFRGSTFACVSPEIEKHANCCNRNNGDKKVCFAEMMDSGHLAMTYTALATLVILGDNLSRVDRVSITRGLKEMQQPDGSFRASFEASENDMRFVYCACAIAHILDDWSGIDKDAIVMFILSSLSYEGCFGQGPNLEAHGGSTYCAIASLSLMGRLHDGTLGQSQKDKAIRWCVLRLNEGFQGRPNKPDDTCYSFWIGAALRLLVPQNDKIEPVISSLASKSHQFVLSTQDAIVGGMAKWPELTSPDPLHTYLGLSGMSLFIGPDDNKSELLSIDAALNISKRAVTHLNQIKKICHTTDAVES